MDHVAVRPAGCTHPGECQRFGPSATRVTARWLGGGYTHGLDLVARPGRMPKPAPTPPVFDVDPARITARGYGREAAGA